MKEISELDVYRLAEEISDFTWYAFDTWSQKVQRTFESNNSFPNLAEGYGRYTPADRRLFYRYARGSFEEAKVWLRKPIRRKIMGPDEVGPFTELIDELGPKLNAFIKGTK